MDSGSGGWLVFQRRTNGSVDFYRNWTQYEQGFGDITGEFWLGLSKLYTLTKGRPTRLRVDLGDVDGHRHYAEYSTFRVDGPETNYTLTVSGYSGDAGDSMEYHNNQSFSTFDRDNDKNSANCAALRNGAWWYNSCHFTNLNSRYKADGAKGPDGLNWFRAHSDWRSFNFSEMKMQPV
ncbi:ficolin-2-like [Pomacea canaliculata]|uniref:ficolin-2-like n=1 Tax=Pomacea canaliculata TaxID=400727 RepID=UPI000D736EC1|nr:ficolin-2-like [Pomacea canaliculata]